MLQQEPSGCEDIPCGNVTLLFKIHVLLFLYKSGILYHQLRTLSFGPLISLWHVLKQQSTSFFILKKTSLLFHFINLQCLVIRLGQGKQRM